MHYSSKEEAGLPTTINIVICKSNRISRGHESICQIASTHTTLQHGKGRVKFIRMTERGKRNQRECEKVPLVPIGEFDLNLFAVAIREMDCVCSINLIGI